MTKTKAKGAAVGYRKSLDLVTRPPKCSIYVLRRYVVQQKGKKGERER